ncbi:MULTISPECIES: DUF2935 domain-containing protein [Bacillaceae]|uniref:DUF2935 domain-containing protein n=1 Tax=Bacillaceae TaxID=186817 RepID=UPI000BFE2B22|nr:MULTISPECIES: DUF2935 domain-containing protein [Bacillaceae]PGT85338.1 hypothetical protein COD11_08900 [Bacillus sp. AFS040349]UGB30171.1 DUF2935 domain-containing protein [Metabacillus sp. B2-18]
MKTYEQAAAFEHQFWLQVLGDHARFILNALSVNEQKDIEKAKEFKDIFDTLLKKSREQTNFVALTLEAEEYAKELRKFKLSIIERHLVEKMTIHLPPSFINHMVNELEEYLLVLSYLKKKEKPPIFHELHHHLLWLLDAAGHAGAISDTLDRAEKQLKQKSDVFTKDFEDFYLKAVELSGYLRANVDSFPALTKMNKDVKLEIELFRGFLAEIEEMELNNEMLSTFSPLMADHMMREECYYLMKVAEASNTEKPNCDPTKPRR